MTPDLSSSCPNPIMVFSVTSSEGGGMRTGGRNQSYNLGKKRINNTHGSLLPPSWLTIYFPIVILIAGLAQTPSRARIAQ